MLNTPLKIEHKTEMLALHSPLNCFSANNIIKLKNRAPLGNPLSFLRYILFFAAVFMGPLNYAVHTVWPGLSIGAIIIAGSIPRTQSALGQNEKSRTYWVIDTPLSSQAAETLRMRPVSRPPTADCLPANITNSSVHTLCSDSGFSGLEHRAAAPIAPSTWPRPKKG